MRCGEWSIPHHHILQATVLLFTRHQPAAVLASLPAIAMLPLIGPSRVYEHMQLAPVSREGSVTHAALDYTTVTTP